MEARVENGTLSLFGFGLDSFVEVISGAGIWHMVRRQRENPEQAPDQPANVEPLAAAAVRVTTVPEL